MSPCKSPSSLKRRLTGHTNSHQLDLNPTTFKDPQCDNVCQLAKGRLCPLGFSSFLYHL